MKCRTTNHSIKSDKYHVSIQKIFPLIEKNHFVLRQEESYLAISIGSPASVGNKAFGIFNFLYKKGINKINVLFGDSMYRYTAMIKYQCDEKHGIQIGINETDKLIQYYASLQNLLPIEFEFMYTSEIILDPQFDIILNKLYSLYEIDLAFRNAVTQFSNFYFDRIFGGNEKKFPEKYLNFSCAYLLEELTVISILKIRGLKKLIYPGGIQIIFDIIQSSTPYLKELFDDIFLVSLRLKNK